jgi:hypothetical protein
LIRVQASLVINRPVDQIFSFVANIENLARWGTGVLEVKKSSPGSISVGTAFMISGRVAFRRSVAPYFFLEYSENRSIVAEGTAGSLRLKESYNREL